MPGKRGPKTQEELLRKLLREPFWPSTVTTTTGYTRLHDDHDGTREGRIILGFTPDGDAWISTDGHRGPTLRFRNMFGGGRSPHTYAALLFLAEAIRLDNEQDPQDLSG